MTLSPTSTTPTPVTPEAIVADAEMTMRTEISAALEQWLTHAGLTQTAAAAVLGVTQARVSEIKHGKTARFSLDLLVRLADRAGLQPRVCLALPMSDGGGAR